MQNIGWDGFKLVWKRRATMSTYEYEMHEVKNDVLEVGPFLLECL